MRRVRSLRTGRTGRTGRCASTPARGKGERHVDPRRGTVLDERRRRQRRHGGQDALPPAHDVARGHGWFEELLL
ncbi:hypothetical protein ACFCZ1_07305 [Streptomyces sp. NPDC056224]|uniref:hypothetical protein n=1 Tax=Streptomyces sp. NPDC056224 TaxID=3345750 RepID=UPI0035E36161